MHIFLQCFSQREASESFTFLHDVRSYADLWQQAEETFRQFLDEGYEIDLYYLFPYAGEQVEVSVRCQQSLDTFLKLAQGEAEAGSVGGGKPPLLYVRECLPLSLPTPSQSPHRSQRASSGVRETEPEDEIEPEEEQPSQRKARKAARPLNASDVASSPVVGGHPTAVGVGVGGQRNGGGVTFSEEERRKAIARMTSPADPYQNHNTAKRLLDSFQYSRTPEGPQLRAVLRNGECSVLVPFNPYNPPDASVLKHNIIERMAAKLQPNVVEAKQYQWLVSAWSSHSENDLDIDDNQDTMFVAKLVKERGDIDVELIVDIVNPQTGSPAKLPPTAILSELPTAHSLTEPTENLQVNLVHTPRKVKRREKELEEKEKKETMLHKSHQQPALTAPSHPA